MGWPDRPQTAAERAAWEGYICEGRLARDGERHAPVWRAIAALSRQNAATRAAVEGLRRAE